MTASQGNSCEQHIQLVEPEDACPRCGEQRMDYLVWIEDSDMVVCQTCGFVYEP